MDLRSNIDRITDNLIVGWAYDGDRPDLPIRIDAYLDGQKVGETTASLMREDLIDAGHPSGHHGFELRVRPETRGELTIILRESESRDIVATVALKLDAGLDIDAPVEEPVQRWAGSVDLFDRQSIEGWALDRDYIDIPIFVEAVTKTGKEILTIADRARMDLTDAGYSDVNHGFKFDISQLSPEDFPIDIRFADTGQRINAFPIDASVDSLLSRERFPEGFVRRIQNLAREIEIRYVEEFKKENR